MGKGVLYKYNATTASKSQSKKFNATTMSDGKVMHTDASNIYQNYPMEQVYEQTFKATWTMGYLGTGAKLNKTEWGDHPRSGDTANFVGLFGFHRQSMRDFLADGVLQEIRIEVVYANPQHNFDPVVNFFPHRYTSEPATWSSYYADTAAVTQFKFVKYGYDYRKTLVLPLSAWMNGDMSGFVVRAPEATAENSARFAGLTTSHDLTGFQSTITLKVLK